MSDIIKIDVSELKAKAKLLHAGDKILLSGWIYTSRDAAHKRINAILDEGGKTPYDLENAVIYYAGPTPAPDGKPIGSCGPTTSSRMDKFAPRFLDLGLGGMIGKGERSQAVRDAIVRNGAIYLCAVGGAGALAAKCIKSCEVIAFEDLGCESVKKLYIEDFPLVVADDCSGGDIFSSGREKYKNNNGGDEKIYNNETNERDDWRITNQEEYLNGVKLKHINFNDAEKKSDHEHCEFCFEEISNYPNCIIEAYCTENEYHWICEKCFNDFNHIFNWMVKD